MLAFGRIIPGEGVEPRVAWTRIARCLGLEPAPEVIHEPQFAARVTGWINSLLAVLQETLRIGECSFFLRGSCGRKKEDLGADGVGRKFATIYLRRCVPEGRSFGLDHIAHDQPLQLGES